MVAETLDRIDEAEARSLRRVVELKLGRCAGAERAGLYARRPHAARQRGYVLIDRREARPDDLFILDSMGRAAPSLGSSRTARTDLCCAMTQRPDAEIAAHLGEVLWKKGDPAARQRSVAVAAAGVAAERGAARDGAPLLEVSHELCARRAVATCRRAHRARIAVAALRALGTMLTLPRARRSHRRRRRPSRAPTGPSRSTAGCRPSAGSDGASRELRVEPRARPRSHRSRLAFRAGAGAHRRRQGPRAVVERPGARPRPIPTGAR